MTQEKKLNTRELIEILTAITSLELVTPGTIKDANGKDAGWRYSIEELKGEFTAKINVKYLCEMLYETLLQFYNKNKSEMDKRCYSIC